MPWLEVTTLELPEAPARKSMPLAEALPLELSRVRDIYLGHKLNGFAAAAFIEQDLEDAEKAIHSGDLIRQIRAHVRLKEITR